MYPPLEIWRSAGSPVHHISIDGRSTEGEMLGFLFSTNYGKRDSTYGRPVFERFESNRTRLTVNVTMIDLAEAFFGDMTSRELSDVLRTHSDPESTEGVILDTVEILDDFFRYAFVLDESRDRGRWDFWRMYVPQTDSSALHRLIPKKYWSSTRYDPLRDEDAFSPLLKVGKETDYVLDLHTRLTRLPEEDAFMLRKIRDSGIDVTNQDHVRVRFLRRWHHPIVMLYNRSHFERFGGCGNLFDAYVPERLAVLKRAYPRLDENRELSSVLGHKIETDPTSDVFGELFSLADAMLREMR